MRQKNEEATWIDAVKQMEQELHYCLSEEILVEECVNNDMLKSRQAISPNNDFDYKNIYRLIRSDMSMMRLVIESMDFFLSVKFSHNTKNLF